MANLLYFAQKGVILDASRTHLLAIHYATAKYTSEKVAGKYGLPGGKITFGENPDQSFVREVEEETGMKISPSLPFFIYTWTYPRQSDQVQIIATARVGHYQSGEPKLFQEEAETSIDEVTWLPLRGINVENFVIDERPVLEKFIEYLHQNPFRLP